MGKDKEGKFHPKKGSPSDDSKEGLGLRVNITPEELEEDRKMTDKYTSGPDTLADNVHLLHPNRNTQKKKERQLTKQEEKEQAVPSGSSPAPEQKTSVLELPYRIDKTALVSLARQVAGRCVSIYMPVHKEGLAVNELNDPIAFKDCIRDAERQLQQMGFSVQRIKGILQPAYDLMQDDNFWRSQLLGLAFFATEGFCRYIKLPEEPATKVIVNDHFLLAPLIPFLTNNEHFYVLTLSKHQAKLFRGDHYGMTPVTVPGMPRGMDDVVHFEEKDEAGVFRTGGKGGTGSANFHGIGGGKPDEKESIGLYFAEVARTVEKEILSQENAPLLLAGVHYLHPIYITAAHYKHIIQEGLKGNYDHMPMPDLHRQAREKLQPILHEEVQRWIDEYNNKSGGALTSPIPADVIPAAYYGQAGRLFVQKDAHIWGRFDAQSQLLEVHDERQAGDDDLVNEAVMQVLLNGGYVHILSKERMPGETVIAALFRYP
jgi:hypothetical protein